MPTGDKKKSKQLKSAFNFVDEKDCGPPEEAPVSSKTARKRKVNAASNSMFSEDESCSEDLRNDDPLVGESDMSSLLNNFGADINKTLSAKRKRLATFTSASLKTSNRKYDELFATQQVERETMNDEFGKQINAVFEQWESDISKSKDGEEKLEAIVRQLQKTLQQQRVVQNQRLKSLKTLHDHYMKGVKDLSTMHHDQQSNIHTELRKELTNLQKKMMDDARQAEILNVRKSLQSMLQSV